MASVPRNTKLHVGKSILIATGPVVLPWPHLPSTVNTNPSYGHELGLFSYFLSWQDVYFNLEVARTSYLLKLRTLVKGTASIKICEIDPAHVKETSLTCDKLNTACSLKDHAFDNIDCLCLFVIMSLAKSVVEC